MEALGPPARAARGSLVPATRLLVAFVGAALLAVAALGESLSADARGAVFSVAMALWLLGVAWHLMVEGRRAGAVRSL